MTTRTEHLHVVLTADEKAMLLARAKRRGFTLTTELRLIIRDVCEGEPRKPRSAAGLITQRKKVG